MERLIGAPPLRYTGKISYGIYLYHLPIYYTLWTYVPGRSPYFYAPIVVRRRRSIPRMTAAIICTPTPLATARWPMRSTSSCGWTLGSAHAEWRSSARAPYAFSAVRLPRRSVASSRMKPPAVSIASAASGRKDQKNWNAWASTGNSSSRTSTP